MYSVVAVSPKKKVWIWIIFLCHLIYVKTLKFYLLNIDLNNADCELRILTSNGGSVSRSRISFKIDFVRLPAVKFSESCPMLKNR